MEGGQIQQGLGDNTAPRPNVWARPPAQGSSAVTLPPPPSAPQPAAPETPPPPYPAYQPFPPPPRRRGRAVWIIAAAAAVLGVAAVVMSVIGLAKPTPAPVTTTVTAASPSYSPEQIAAAKKDACAASMSINSAITASQRAYVAALPNRDSPDAKAALSNFQLVVMVETQYLRTHTQQAAPQDVKDATNEYINAWLALVDADTRGIPDADAQKFVRDVRLAGDRLDKVCE